MCTCTPPMLQFLNFQASKHQLMPQMCSNAPPIQSTLKFFSKHKNLSRSTPSPTRNRISNSRTCMNGPITYWSTIELEITLHKQLHIYKGIWTMLGLRWLPPPLALPYITFSLVDSYNEYGMCQFPLSHKPYEFIQTFVTLKPLTITIICIWVI